MIQLQSYYQVQKWGITSLRLIYFIHLSVACMQQLTRFPLLEHIFLFHLNQDRVNIERWGKAAWFFLCEIRMKPRQAGLWCNNCTTQRRLSFQFWLYCGIPVQSCKIILLLCPYWFENRILSCQNMGTNLELGYHHGECCLYSNAHVSIKENPKQLQLQKKTQKTKINQTTKTKKTPNQNKKGMELEMLTWDLREQGSSLTSVR